ncbi:MarR family transcriptional regulator [Desulfobaculum bizertense]|uniref:MarR family transcriptional regulator n=1 Tax=Desulfobaculum bizertense TaxID=376490 RepID=UPI001F3BD9FD|nr:MarR family transcriptional regulator [Desulfobaculum bizertense]UIJ37993.1 MarR family transcriptional regulator [Desulfobaculum bizertense]
MVLTLLMDAPESQMTPSELASKAGVTRATMTGLLDRLETEGHVTRAQSQEDRRKLTINLTQAGQDFTGCPAEAGRAFRKYWCITARRKPWNAQWTSGKHEGGALVTDADGDRSREYIAGVDGTKNGWILTKAKNWPCTEIPDVFANNFEELIALTQDCDAIALDMPLGLPPATKSEPVTVRPAAFLNHSALAPGSRFTTLFNPAARGCMGMVAKRASFRSSTASTEEKVPDFQSGALSQR